MFSIYTLKSAKDAGKYYQKDNYYAKEAEHGYCIWHGKGAQILGLHAKVNYEKFQQKLGGKLTDDLEMIQVKNGGHHRPGYDLTFSAPKSVSILGIVGKDNNVILAHRKAVIKTLNYIEENYAAVRSKSNGVVSIEKTDNLSFALFEHTDSRELDPNLHTHSILMNFTQRKDGHWRTIYGDELYSNKILIGMLYRSALAKELMVMGYNIVQTSEKGTFELEGFDQKLLDQFSKRRQQITEKLHEMRQTGGKAAKMANFLTRKEKKGYDLEQIEMRWKNELKDCGYSINWLNNYSVEAKLRGPVILQNSNDIAKKSIDSALKHLTEKRAVFAMDEIVKTAFGMSLIHADKETLMEEITKKIEQGELLHLGKHYFTTQAAREKEITIACYMRQDKGQVKPLCDQMIAGMMAKFCTKDNHQRDALKFILTSSDRQISIKTTDRQEYYALMNIIKKSGKQTDYYPIAITNNMIFGSELKAKTGLNKVFTVQSFLESCEKRAKENGRKAASKTGQYQGRQVWVIDPSAKVNLDQGEKLQTWAKHFGARIIWFGNESYSAPVFSLLMRHGIASGSLDQLSTVNKTDSLIGPLKTLHENKQIQAFAEPKERVECLVDYYFSLPKEDRILLVVSHSDRLQVNQSVREKMILRGELGHEFVKYKSLQPLYFSQEQKQLGHLYQPEDVLYFRAQNNYYTVHEIDIEKNRLTLIGHDGKLMQWQPSQAENDMLDIYRTESRELRIGDKIVWTKTIKDKGNKKLNRNQGESAQVISLNNNTAQICLQNGKKTLLDRADMAQAHFDHGYANMLSQTSVGAKNDAVLLITTNQIPYLDRERLSFAIQNNKGFHIICDDAIRLQNIMPDKNIQPQLATANRTILFEKWNGSAMSFGRLTEMVNEVINKSSIDYIVPSIATAPPLSEKQKIAHDAVDYICSKLCERDAVFSLEQAKQEAYMLAGLRVSKEEIDSSFKTAFEKRLLVDVGDNKATTQGTLLIEKACLQFVKQGQNAVEPILPQGHPTLDIIEQNDQLTRGQKDAVSLILTTSDRAIGIQGVAGAGKTTMLKEVNKSCRKALNEVDRLSQDAGFRVMGLANTASAKNRIREATQTLGGTAIPAMTIKKFINHADKLLASDPDLAQSLYGKNQIFVLDEASLASSRDVFSILSLINRLDARLLLVGDVKQLSPIEAGNPWRLLLGSDMKSVAIKENVRFKDQQTVAIMKDLYAGNVDDAIRRLEPKTIEIPDRKELLKAIANFYVSLGKEIQGKVLIISPRNEDRVAINYEIREIFKRDGTLLGKEFKTQVLLPKNMTDVERNSHYSYQEGDYIRVNYYDKRLGLQSGDYLQVVGKDIKKQHLTLKFSDGRNILWSPNSLPRWSGAIEIYQVDQRSLMVGETLRWRKNDEARSIVNGEIAKLVKLEGVLATLCLKNGKIIDINFNELQNQHWDHAYASTVFVAQGQDVSLTIGLCQGPKPYQKETKDLCVGDVITLPAKMLGEKFSTLAVVHKNSDNQLIFKDRDNMLHSFDMKTLLGKQWAYFPAFDERKHHGLPASSSLSSFLVQATRGDNFMMFVDNLDYFKKTIEAQSGIKETAIQYLDSEWAKAYKKIENMTQNVSGVAQKTKENSCDIVASIIKKVEANFNNKVSWKNNELNKDNEILK